MIIAEDESQIGDFIYGCVDWKTLGISEIYRCTNGEDALLYVCQEMPEAEENFVEE